MYETGMDLHVVLISKRYMHVHVCLLIVPPSFSWQACVYIPVYVTMVTCTKTTDHLN